MSSVSIATGNTILLTIVSNSTMVPNTITKTRIMVIVSNSVSHRKGIMTTITILSSQKKSTIIRTSLCLLTIIPTIITV